MPKRGSYWAGTGTHQAAVKRLRATRSPLGRRPTRRSSAGSQVLELLPQPS